MCKRKENLVYPHLVYLVTIAEWKYPFPSRTRKSSALTPMVLQQCGRVGSRQVFFLPLCNHAAIFIVTALGPYTIVLSLACSLNLIRLLAQWPILHHHSLSTFLEMILRNTIHLLQGTLQVTDCGVHEVHDGNDVHGAHDEHDAHEVQRIVNVWIQWFQWRKCLR